jgi:hypothetical protein
VTGGRAAQAFGYTPSLYELVDVLNWGRLCKIDVVLAMYSTLDAITPHQALRTTRMHATAHPHGMNASALKNKK